MGALDRYLAGSMMANSPALMQEYIADKRAAEVAAATPEVFGMTQPQAQEQYAQQYQGLMDAEGVMNAPQTGTGLFDDSVSENEKWMRFNRRAGVSGSPDFQDMMFQNMQSMNDSTVGSSVPMNVKEWKYYSGLEETDKEKYLDMKRGGTKVVKINGVPTVVPMNYVEGGAQQPRPLSDIGSEAEAAETLAAASQQGSSAVLSEWKRIDAMKDTIGSRQSGIRKAKYFYDLLERGEMASGGMRKLLSYIPFTFTEQGRMDEEFNAFAETAARAALKASGEIRPTDADVKGMKQAMFGIGRDEKVNQRLLNSFMNSLQRDNHEAYQLGVGTEYIENRMNEHYDLTDDDIATMENNHNLDRRGVYLQLWKKYNKEIRSKE